MYGRNIGIVVNVGVFGWVGNLWMFDFGGSVNVTF